MKDYKQQTLQALRMFNEPCIGTNNRFHGGNCQACCLRGDGLPNTADSLGLEPNYAGWARIYVQAGRAIPARFAAAFEREKESKNTLYAEALADDIAHYGVKIQSV